MMLYYYEADEELRDLKENLQHLTVGIPVMTTDEVPRRCQCHTVGVSGWSSRRLRRVAQAIACYHEHHEDYSALIFTFCICITESFKDSSFSLFICILNLLWP